MTPRQQNDAAARVSAVAELDKYDESGRFEKRVAALEIVCSDQWDWRQQHGGDQCQRRQAADGDAEQPQLLNKALVVVALL